LPNLVTPPDDTTIYTGVDTPLTFDYTITSASNGPDTYTLGANVDSSTNTTGPSNSVPANVVLGASVTSAVTGSTTTLQVPSDGGAADIIVNGIEAGDTIVVDVGSGPEVVTVLTVVDAGGSGSAIITLDTTSTPALTASAPVGTPIYEQKTFTLTVDSGTITTAGTDITVTSEVTVTNSAGTLTDTVVATYTSGNATLTKYVRNLTRAAANASGSGAQSFTIDGRPAADYYTGDVTGQPGETLEYILVAENVGTAELTAAVVSDVLPVTFVDFSTGVYNTSTDDVFYIDAATSATDSFPADGTDLAAFTSPNLAVDVVGDLGDVATSAGKIPAGGSVTIAYQVTIK